MSSERYVAQMPPSKPKGSGPPVAPVLSSEPTAAPTDLIDEAEWVGVVATQDYIGQRANDVDWRDVTIRGGRWSGVTIEHLRATDVTFEDCDLSGLVLQDHTSLRRIVFERCRMTGAVLAGAELRDVTFNGCTLVDANLRMLDAEKLDFNDCVLTGADFHGAKISYARMIGCDLRNVDFTKARLREVDLRTSRLEDFAGADALRGAIIDPSQVLALAHSFAVAIGVQVVDDENIR